MNIVVYHRDCFTPALGSEFFQSMLSIEPLGQMIRNGVCVDLSGHSVTDHYHWCGEPVYAVPDDWEFVKECNEKTVIRYSDALPLVDSRERLPEIEPWNLILNGNYAATRLTSE